MPWPMEMLAKALPMRYYLVIARTLHLKGGNGLLPDQIAPLACLALAYVALAIARFRRIS
jgi:hypothetical protein